MTTFDIASQQIKGVIDLKFAEKIFFRIIDQIDHIHVNGKGGTVDRADQLQIGFRGIGKHPRHGFQCIEGLFRANAVNFRNFQKVGRSVSDPLPTVLAVGTVSGTRCALLPLFGIK